MVLHLAAIITSCVGITSCGVTHVQDQKLDYGVKLCAKHRNIIGASFRSASNELARGQSIIYVTFASINPAYDSVRDLRNCSSCSHIHSNRQTMGHTCARHARRPETISNSNGLTTITGMCEQQSPACAESSESTQESII